MCEVGQVVQSAKRAYEVSHLGLIIKHVRLYGGGGSEGGSIDIQKSTVPPAVTEAVEFAFSAFLLQMMSPVVYAVGAI